LAGAARRSGASDVGDFSSAGNHGQTQKKSSLSLPSFLKKSNRRMIYQNDPFFEKRPNKK
jgi:hypothetical protein